MEADRDALERRVSALLAGQDLGVLATCGQGQPYASLVAFAATPDLGRLLFATARRTRKFANIEAEPRVSLLVDSRTHRQADFREAAAVTATGRAREVEDSARGELLSLYVGKHPHLGDFARDPGCALVAIRVDAYFLVRRFQEVDVLSMPQ